jgi:hypothetical protein
MILASGQRFVMCTGASEENQFLKVRTQILMVRVE